MDWAIPVVVALISGPIVVLLQWLRKENTSQHAESRGILTHILDKIEKIDDKFDTHMEEKH
jgi:hypothetical protein